MKFVFRPTKATKYLCIMLGNGGKFGNLVEQVKKRVGEKMGMSNIRGSCGVKVKIVCIVVHSFLLYGTERDRDRERGESCMN